MADFLTITENYIKKQGIITENVDSTYVRPTIIFVQDEYMHPILGTDLFNEIKEQIIAGTVSAANQTLLNDHILKVMLWYCKSAMTYDVNYKYMNKGVMSKNSENSNPVDLSTAKTLMDEWRSRAEMYSERCTRFLKANTDTYPLYCANTDCDDIKPNKSNYTTGIYLGDDECDEFNIRTDR